MKNVIFIAPPAAGKGTQSDKLVEKYGYVHISTGDILRYAVKEESELGLKVKSYLDRGKFVTDSIMINLIKDTLMNINKPFILDGYPRTLKQARALTNILEELNISDYKVIFLDVSEDIAMKRALGRMVCSHCKRSYNKYFEELKPKTSGICNKCGHKLEVRTDDNKQSFKTRFEDYLSEIASILEYYKKKELLIDINAENSDKKIFCDIIKELNND
ncbi:MAG: nucleoside monophosphate kinase [Bacilli bacterium]|nr:nucleoside monophosphate kinase [Bacilli bacterium]